MTETRLPAAWLRPLVALFALAGTAGALGAAAAAAAPRTIPTRPGPATPGPLVILPADSTVYSGIPATLTVTGGVPPYSPFSSNSAILPVTQTVAGSTVLLLAANVGPRHPVTITVQDAAGTTATSHRHRPRRTAVAEPHHDHAQRRLRRAAATSAPGAPGRRRSW